MTHQFRVSVRPPHLAASLVILDLLGLQVDIRLTVGAHGRLRLHSGLDLRSHRQKSLFNIRAGLGGSLQKLNTKRVGKLLALLRAHDTLGRQIRLVAHEQLVDILCRVSVNFVQPLLHIVERLRIRHVVYDDNAMSAAVVRGSNGSEAFLSGSIPNLKLDRLAVEINRTDFLQKSKQYQEKHTTL